MLTLLIPGVVTVSGQTREISQVILVNDYTYEIEVGGSRDPVNETIIIENLGNVPLVNPRIMVGWMYDWYDMESLAREVTRDCRTDEEKALAIWHFIRLNFQHLDSPGDRECQTPVVAMNVYGYANCAYHSSVFTALCRAAGVPARVWGSLASHGDAAFLTMPGTCSTVISDFITWPPITGPLHL